MTIQGMVHGQSIDGAPLLIEPTKKAQSTMDILIGQTVWHGELGRLEQTIVGGGPLLMVKGMRWKRAIGCGVKR